MNFFRQIPDWYYIIAFFILSIYLFFCFKNYKKDKNLVKIFFKAIFLIYCFLIVYFCFLTPGFIEKEISIQLVPFSSIYEIWNHSVHYKVVLKQIWWNFILLFPAWFLLPIISEKNFSFKKALFYGLMISFSIEFIQLFMSITWINYKVFDIDDIILNTTWFVLWFLCYKIFEKIIIKNS